MTVSNVIVIDGKLRSLFSEISVGFDPVNYTTTEGETLSVCASISNGTSTINFSIPLAISGGTAESKCVN